MKHYKKGRKHIIEIGEHFSITKLTLSEKEYKELANYFAQQQVKNLNIPAVSNRREQLIAFAQWLAHEEEYGKDGAIGTVDAYLESN